jgi:two-component system chemotaxis response regulator CheY
MKSAPPLSKEHHPGTTGSILVVDDQESIRRLVSIIVRAAGYGVIEAVDGEDALSQIAGKDITMVITDLRMPNMDGLELVRRLRQHPEHRFTPVIMLSSEFLGNRIKDACDAGVSDWITKPFIHHQLAASIKKAAQGNSSIAQAAAAPA